MRLSKTYGFDDDEARERLRALSDYWAAKYGIRTDWRGDVAHISGKVRGVRFDGDVTVRDGRVDADIEAGFLAEKLGGRKYVEGKLEAYLDPGATLEALRARVPR